MNTISILKVPTAKFEVSVNEPELKVLRRALRDYKRGLQLAGERAEQNARGALETEMQLLQRIIDHVGK